MKYGAIAIAVGAFLGGALWAVMLTGGSENYATVAWAGEEVKDTNGDGVLSGRELTLNDWIRCRDQTNFDREASGSALPQLTVLPTQREDGEWTFNAGNKELNPTGEFYICGR